MFTDFITNMINSLSELLYSHILIILLLGAGIFFTIKTKFVQIRMFIESLRVVAQPGSCTTTVSTSSPMPQARIRCWAAVMSLSLDPWRN